MSPIRAADPRVRVNLKHRTDGTVRIVRPDPADRDEFIAVLSAHRAKFIDPNGERDQYFFTTETGRPIDLANFSRDWWKPARDAVFGDHELFADLPFRRLRAAAITDWLHERGWSLAHAAQQAGNSQAVIEKHYAGVLEARSRTHQHSPESIAVTQSAQNATRPVVHMTDVEIAAEDARLQAEIAALAARQKAVLAERMTRLTDVTG